VDWRAVPHFGTRPGGRRSIVRPSAYAFLQDRAGRLAVVRATDGVFLPGGGLENGESTEAAVAREALEECGLVVRVGARVSRLVQFVVTAGGVSVEKRCVFFDARIERANRAAMLPGHETLWLGPASAARILKHDSQMWAVRDWMKLRGAPRRGGLS
jgi:8-oxo-dGTP diphosphatase